MDGLFFELPYGLHINGDVYKDVELLSTNGVAEKIFTKKIAEKPFTWQGNIVAAAVKRIGNVEIGSEVRKKYLEDGSVTIPTAVLKLPLAEVNTLLVEIHRRVWVSFIPKQEILCKYCGRRRLVDIDLDKIDYSEEDKERIQNLTSEVENISVELTDGFVPPVINKLTDKEEFSWITSTKFNRFLFRVPLLEDAIRHEKYFADSIGFWRRIAMDCLISVDRIEDGKVVATLPKEFHTWYGLKMFNEYLSARDLREIRNRIIDCLPTLPFAYYGPCGCDENREIPMVMEASNFFSE